MAAVLIPIINIGGEDHIICEVRSENVPQPGEICMPGGGSEPGETYTETAVRETVEELGIREEHIHPTGQIITAAKSTGGTLPGVVAMIDADALDEIIISEEEVAEVFAVPVDWLKANAPAVYDYQDTSKMPAKLREYLTHYSPRLDGNTICWEYDGHVIWGLTARLIKEYIDSL